MIENSYSMRTLHSSIEQNGTLRKYIQVKIPYFNSSREDSKTQGIRFRVFGGYAIDSAYLDPTSVDDDIANSLINPTE
jgi:hypothetical protein